MKHLKYVFAALIAVMFFTVSCEKDETIQADPLGEISFLTNRTETDVLAKSSFIKDEYPICSDADAASVHLVIDDVSYILGVTSLGTGETEVLKLLEGDHIITEFAVMDASDNAIYTMPKSDSKAALAYGLKGLPHTFTIEAFKKIKEEIDVLCYEPGSYKLFGYSWFQYNVYIERELFFFGDICTKFFTDWHVNSSPYYGQDYDGYDFPAIFRIDILRGDDVIDSQSNLDFLGEGNPLSVKYIDNPVIDNEPYSFEIYLLMPNGDEELVHTEAFADGISSEDGDVNGFGGVDGVYDFSVGSCDSEGNNDADLELPAWMPVPTSGKFTLSGGLYPTNGDGYIKVTFTDIVGGHPDTIDSDMVSYVYCAAEHDNIQVGKAYESNFYSSLELLNSIPSEYSGIEWGALNWIMNNQGNYNTNEIQEAIWYFTNGEIGTGNSLAVEASNHKDFQPKVGDWAIILCDAIEETGVAKLQLMIVRVDP